MATVTETGTFAPVTQLWQQPMLPDNTPVARGRPIGRVTWYDSEVTAAKITTDVVELAVSCSVPPGFALRLMNIQWSMLLTDSDATADMNDWSDAQLLTVPTADETISYNLRKNNSAQAYTITNRFTSELLVPAGAGGLQGEAGGEVQFSDPFIPTTGIIFRIINTSANASAAMTFTSHMWAYLYTIEQYNQGGLWSSTSVGSSS